MFPDRGVVYIAFGDEYQQEAIQSAVRVSELGDWPLCLMTDKVTREIENNFDFVKELDGINYEDLRYGGKIKPICLSQVSSDEVLYLDSDTYVVNAEVIPELFQLLERYELAAAHDTHRRIEWQYNNSTVPEETTPEAFPWLNTGVMVYKNTPNIQNLFNNWEELYEKQSQIIEGVNDQSSFTEALYESEVNHTVLPEEYNHRTLFQQTLRGEVKVVHGHHRNVPEIAAYINDNLRKNVDDSGDALFHTYHHIPVNKGDTSVAIPSELSRNIRHKILSKYIFIKNKIEIEGIFGVGEKIKRRMQDRISNSN